MFSLDINRLIFISYSCYVVLYYSTLTRCGKFYAKSDHYLQKLSTYTQRLQFANSRIELLQGEENNRFYQYSMKHSYWNACINYYCCVHLMISAQHLRRESLQKLNEEKLETSKDETADIDLIPVQDTSVGYIIDSIKS